MDYLYLVAKILLALAASGSAQLRDPPRLFNRLTSFNCIVYIHAFHCVTDNSCIPPERVRDGSQDCTDNSDESPTINICDYAPYYPDYRCSAYAECLNQPDGYTCRCRSGYVGSGEKCQPAPLNLPQFITTPKTLIIQTWRENTSASGTEDQTTSLNELSNEILRISLHENVRDQGNTDENLLWGRPVREDSSDRPLKLTVRELYSNLTTPLKTSEMILPFERLQISGGDMKCPNRTLMVNESGQIWCLTISKGNLERNPSTAKMLRIPASFIPTTNTNADTGTGRNSTAIAEGKAVAPPASMFPPGPPFMVVTNREKDQDSAGVYNMTMGGLRDLHLTDSRPFLGHQGNTRITENGAVFGYMSQAIPSRRPGVLNVNSSAVVWTRGSIITPVKVWNATGSAVTAYRVTPNASLPASCITGPQRMFMCALRDQCINPSQILDGREDCSDGSDEVPEFIDECAFGTDWPQFRCAGNADCTDTITGYICTCFVGSYWAGSACVEEPVNGSSAIYSTDAGNDGTRTDHAFESSPSAVSAGEHPDDLPTRIIFTVYPRKSTWSILPKNVFGDKLYDSRNFTTPMVHLPTVLCVDCVFPELVTAGPLLHAGAQDSNDHDLNRPANSTGAERGPLLANLQIGETDLSSWYSRLDNREVTVATTQTRQNNSQSMAIDSAASTNLKSETAPPVDNQWTAVLDALRKITFKPQQTTPAARDTISSSVPMDGTRFNQTTSIPSTEPPTSAGYSVNGRADQNDLITATEAPSVSFPRTNTNPNGSTYNNLDSSGNAFRRVPNSFVGTRPRTSLSTVTTAGTTTPPGEADARNQSSGHSHSAPTESGFPPPPADADRAQNTMVSSTTLPTGKTRPNANITTTTSSADASTETDFFTLHQPSSVGGETSQNVATRTGKDAETNIERPSTMFSSNAQLNVDRSPNLHDQTETATANQSTADTVSGVISGWTTVVTLGGVHRTTPGIQNGGFATTSGPHNPGPLLLNLGTVEKGQTDGIPTVNLTGGSFTTLFTVRSSSHTDDRVTGTVNPFGTTIVLVTPPNRSTSPIRVAEIVPYVPSNRINAATYPTGVFWNFPISQGASPPAGLQALNGSNSSGLPLDQTYPCFADLFRTAYASLQRNVKRCDQGCEVNGTEKCVRPVGRCECAPGTTRSQASGKCQASVQWSVGFSMTELCGKPLAYQSYMSDLSNTATQQLAVVVCYQMEQLINKTTMGARYSPGSCNPNGFTAGSVVSKMALSFVAGNDTSQPSFRSDLMQALSAALLYNEGSLGDDANGLQIRPVNASVRLGNMTVQRITFETNATDIDECMASVSPCGNNSNCQNVLGSFTCSCRSGFTDRNPRFPGRSCMENLSLNNTALTLCPIDFYIFGYTCLFRPYYVLAIIAIIIACILLLMICGCLIAWCCRCCGFKRDEFTVPQAALIRAAQRSPGNAVDPSAGNYQEMKSEADAALDPNRPRRQSNTRAEPPHGNNFDLEKGDHTRMLPGNDEMEIVKETVTKERKGSVDDVDTWEEVEVPNFEKKEEDMTSKRALSPSQGSMLSRAQKLDFEGGTVEETLEETVVKSEIPTEIFTEELLQRTEMHEREVHDADQTSGDIDAGTFVRPDDDLSRFELTTEEPVAVVEDDPTRFDLTRTKKPTDARDWIAIPRTESLIMEDDGMNVDTLPDTSYQKNPVYSMNAPIAGMETKFDEKDLRRLGMGFRDSFDDVVDQIPRFYKESSSDIDFEREVDLSQLKETETVGSLDTKTHVKDDKDSSDDEEEKEANGRGPQRQPAYLLEQRGNISSIETDDDGKDNRGRSTRDEEDQQSLKSTDEDELRYLPSPKGLTLVRDADPFEEAIDEMVEEQPVFYSRQGSSDEETFYQKKNSLLKTEPTARQSDTKASPRKVSDIQREIAIKEFGALGERDSIDDVLDGTSAFFSRTSTLESFLIQKTDSTDDSSPGSRKTSQTFLGVESGVNVEQSPRRRTLLKKRSAFHSRDSMNKIMESSTNEDTASSQETLRGAVTSPPDRDEYGEEMPRSHTTEPSATHVYGRSHADSPRRGSLQQTMVISDDDLADFPMPKEINSRMVTDTVVRGRTDTPTTESGEHFEESVREYDADELVNSPRNSTEVREAAYNYQTSRKVAWEDDDSSPTAERITEAVVRSVIEPRRDSVTVTYLDETVHEDDNSPRNSTDIRLVAYGKEIFRTASINHGISLSTKLSEQDNVRGASGETETMVRSEDVGTYSSEESSPVNVHTDESGDIKSVKSISDHNLNRETSPPFIPYDSDSGVYVDAGHRGGSSGSASRRKQATSSQDDLHVFDQGQEARRQDAGSDSSYQRLSQSDDEEEVMQRYTTAYKTKMKKTTTRRVRHNYDMGPPESRHVYFSSRPKRMPPKKEDLDVWRDSNWWRLHK